MESEDLKPRLIDIPRVCDPRGNLSFLQRPGCLPFDVKRVYYLYDVPCDSERGGHSHRQLQQLLIAVTGAFDVNVDDGNQVTTYHLCRPYQGLYLPRGYWRTLSNFTSGAVCLVLASDIYDEAEYVREYDEFKFLVAKKKEKEKAAPRYPFLDLGIVNAPYKRAIKDAVSRVIDSGRYIGGTEVENLERELSQMVETPFVIAVSTGLDALRLILRGYIELGRLKPGDEVIVPADTFVATALAVTDNGLIPVFADVDPVTANLSADTLRRAITPRTRAVMLVHLYGRVCWDEEIDDVIFDNKLLVIEDNAQALGAHALTPGLNDTYAAGSLGHAAGVSFYPTKNVGALGDAGAITTCDGELALVVRALRNYGTDAPYHNIYAGLNCRLDPMQAAILRVKLPYLNDENAQRRALAHIYDAEIHNPLVTKPKLGGADCIWHQYVVLVEDRDRFRKYLLDHGVETNVHYPMAVHHQPCYSQYADVKCPNAETITATCVSLPISSCTSAEDARAISSIINTYK